MADILASIATLMACVLSSLSYQRSTRPSTLLNIHLSVSALLGVARTRTLWLLSHNTGRPHAAVAMTAVLALSVATLILESVEKNQKTKEVDACDTEDHKLAAPEQYSGLWSRTCFVWLVSTLWRGYSKVISLDDLPPLDAGLESDAMLRKLSSTWAKCKIKAMHLHCSIFDGSC